MTTLREAIIAVIERTVDDSLGTIADEILAAIEAAGHEIMLKDGVRFCASCGKEIKPLAAAPKPGEEG